MPQLTSTQPVDGGIALGFAGADPNDLAQRVDAFFRGEGYKLEEGAPGNAAYGTGSNVMRILFGAFAKRYKFNAVVQADQGQTWVTLTKAMSGAMGGVIGHSKMTKETNRITAALQACLATDPVAPVPVAQPAQGQQPPV